MSFSSSCNLCTASESCRSVKSDHSLAFTAFTQLLWASLSAEFPLFSSSLDIWREHRRSHSFFQPYVWSSWQIYGDHSVLRPFTWTPWCALNAHSIWFVAFTWIHLKSGVHWMQITSNPPQGVDCKWIQVWLHYCSWVTWDYAYYEIFVSLISLPCGACYITIFCSSLAILGKKETCLLMAKKSGTAW